MQHKELLIEKEMQWKHPEFIHNLASETGEGEVISTFDIFSRRKNKQFYD